MQVSIFKRNKPTIVVIDVKNEIREVSEERMISSGLGYGYTQDKKTADNVNYTIVLFTKDGELMTREFNGKWDLTDIKKWEDL